MQDFQNIILFDMDNTLCDYDKALTLNYNAIKSPEDPEYVSYSPKILKSKYLSLRIDLIRNQKNWWINLEKYKPGFDILNLAKELGFAIHILTKSPKTVINSWSEKVEWCEKNLKDYDVKITISDDKSLVYGKVLVDDYPPYIQNWLNKRPRGLVIMPLQSWNKDFEHDRVIKYDGNNLEEVKQTLIIAKDREYKEQVNYKK